MKQMIKKLAIVLSVALVCAPMGAMAANKLIVKDATGTIDKMVVTDSGFIGIGTNAPLVGLHAKGNSATLSQFRAHFNAASANGGGSFVMMHNNGSSTALPLSGDRLGLMSFGTESIVPATGALGTYFGATITVRADGNWVNNATTTSLPAYISLSTAAATGGAIERVKVASNGNVGIGYFNTANPTQRLEVKGGVKVNSTGTKPTCDATSRGTFWVTQSATTTADTAEVCTKDAGTAYSWKAIY